MLDTLSGILACPTCRQTLVFDSALRCPGCGKEVATEGRLLDFTRMTPDLPLYYVKLSRDLHEYAGNAMKDVCPDWRVQRVLSVVRENAHGTVCLEIGGADGPMTPHLESLFEIVLTIDLSRTFLSRIEAKTSKTICLLGDAQFSPIQDRTVDMVVCSEVLEHACVPTQLLYEIRRVMKKDATCILSVPYEAKEGPQKRLGLAKQLSAFDSHINFYGPRSLNKLLFRMGLEIVDIQILSSLASLVRMLPKRPVSFLAGILFGQYILCVLRTMDNPQIYWETLKAMWSQQSGI